MTSKRVAVLMGGWSSEREVSLVSGAAVVESLKELGYEVLPIDVSRDLQALLNALTPRPDVIFNALHGVGGEDGTIQGVLEILGIPYTHSGVVSSAIAMDKILSRKVFASEGIKTPEWELITFDDLKKGHPMLFPYVIKPVGEGSSRGVYIVCDDTEYNKAIENWCYGNDILIEKYIPGKEIQVAVINNQAIGAIEICPLSGFYDYEAKYTPGKAEHIMPARLSPKAYQTSLDLALKAHKALNCRGVTRADFRYDDTHGGTGDFYLLEVNTQPGMTPLSLVPEIAAFNKMNFSQLIQSMIENAECGL